MRSAVNSSVVWKLTIEGEKTIPLWNSWGEEFFMTSLNVCLSVIGRLGFFSNMWIFLSFFFYILPGARFEHYRQVYIVHSGLQDESLQVTISKLP